MWSGVNPVRTSFGSAPASISAIASSKRPFCTASVKGLATGPLAANGRSSRPTSRRCARWTLHHRLHIGARSESARTVSRWPSRTAKNNAVKPESSVASLSAPASISVRTTAACPSAAAHIKAVWPSRSRASGRRAGEQRLYRVDIPRARSQHEGGFSASQRSVRICAGLQEQLHNGSVAVRTCLRQRRHAIAIKAFTLAPAFTSNAAVSASSL